MSDARGELADKLERLCCAETEGKFFDCVTDNIQTIIAALRAMSVPKCEAEPDEEHWMAAKIRLTVFQEQGKTPWEAFEDAAKLLMGLARNATPPSRSDVGSAEAIADVMVRDMFAPHELPLDAELAAKYLNLARKIAALVPPPSEAGRDKVRDALKHARFDLQAAKVLAQHTLGEPHGINQTLKLIDDAIIALSPDPGTVAVASAQYRCTCGAEPYCAPNVHAASCPLAVTSTLRETPA